MQTLLQGITGQLAHTLQMHAMPANHALCHDMLADKAQVPGVAGPCEDVAGRGKLQDFSSAGCKGGRPAGQASSHTDGRTKNFHNPQPTSLYDRTVFLP